MNFQIFTRLCLLCCELRSNARGRNLQSKCWTRPVENLEGSPFRSCDFWPETAWRVLAHRTPDPSRSRVLFPPPILVKSRPGARQRGIRDRWRRGSPPIFSQAWPVVALTRCPRMPQDRGGGSTLGLGCQAIAMSGACLNSAVFGPGEQDKTQAWAVGGPLRS